MAAGRGHQRRAVRAPVRTATTKVRSITLAANGLPPVRAALRGPYWIVRVVVPAGPGGARPALRSTLSTYDGAGARIGQFQIFG